MSTGIPEDESGVEVFPPTLREVMLRPRWLALLGACLVAAAIFAWLGQWQLSRAIDTTPQVAGASEKLTPLDSVLGPGEYLPEPLVGQRVRAEGTWAPGDAIVVSSRFNQGDEGFWVTGHLRLNTAAPTSLAVALGWTKTRADAERAAALFNDQQAEGSTAAVTVIGRLVPSETPVVPRSGDPTDLTRMAPAALLARWQVDADTDVYRPFVIAAEPIPGTLTIHAPPPGDAAGVNWLNIFYAAEWVIFAGFAFYLWYRLARDEWSREIEELAEAPTPTSPARGAPGGDGRP